MSERICLNSPSSAICDGARRVVANDWLIVVLVALIATAVRWLFILYNPRVDGFLIYQGQPLSDGCTYILKALSIAQGHGIPPVQQPAIRPFYSMTLACLYTWFGFARWAVGVLNLVIGAFTAALIYLCGARALNRFCGVGAALFFAIDPSQLLQVPQAGTEPLGLLFFVASVYAALVAFETGRTVSYFLCGLFIGLSNITRTLTIFTLPFFLGLIVLLVGARARAWRAALIYALAMGLGAAVVISPWIWRQERTYGISSISDNIGEALYAATSPKYKQWTPLVRRDAVADGIPDTVGDRYRYFMRRAVENVKRDPGFFLRQVGVSLWNYANSFNPNSRASSDYEEDFSRAGRSQRALVVFLAVFVVAAWLLEHNAAYSRHALFGMVASLCLAMVYYVLPSWLGFVPISIGLVFSWRAGRRLAALILCGSLVIAALGSAMFANATIFRSILMTDWLFLFYFFAAIWFPVEVLVNGSVGQIEAVWATRSGQLKEETRLQSAVSVFSRRLTWGVLGLFLTFFACSAVRLIILIKTNPPRHVVEHQLTRPEVRTLLRQLQRPPFDVLPREVGDAQDYDDLSTHPLPLPNELTVVVQRFDFAYYIPAGKVPPRGRSPLSKPYARTLVILPKFDFLISGEIPSRFARQPLVFVGISTEEDRTPQGPPRVQMEGLAIVPFDQHRQPDAARAISAPPSASCALAGPRGM